MGTSAATLSPLTLEQGHCDLPHSFFRFPGKIHPPLVRKIIEDHPDIGLWMDSMAGCGTVALETVAAGKDGVFGDLDPVSCLITRVKTSPISSENLLSAFAAVMDKTQTPAKGEAAQRDVEALAEQLPAAGYGSPDNLFHWYEPHAAHGIASFLLSISDNADLTDVEQRAMESLVAASARRLSRADPSTVSCLGVTKVRLKQLQAGINFDVHRTLRNKASYLAKGFDAMLTASTPIGSATVLNEDARRWAAACQEMQVTGQGAITSPPYCHAIEYWRRHRLEYSWLNLVQTNRLRDYTRNFIGITKNNGTDTEARLPAPIDALASKVGERGTPRAEHLLRQYFHDLATWIEQTCGALEPEAPFFVIAGANTVQGVPIDTPHVIDLLAQANGYETVRQEDYLYENQVMQYPTSHGHRVHGESIVQVTA